MEGVKVEISEIEIKEGKPQKIPVFWILVANKEELYLYVDREEAVTGLSEAMPKNKNASLAMIYYKDTEAGGTFTVEGMSWKDIALGWLKTKDSSSPRT